MLCPQGGRPGDTWGLGILWGKISKYPNMGHRCACLIEKNPPHWGQKGLANAPIEGTQKIKCNINFIMLQGKTF
jgi:hypothetical protein